MVLTNASLFCVSFRAGLDLMGMDLAAGHSSGLVELDHDANASDHGRLSGNLTLEG